jgi:hypothetical protein
MNVDDKQCTSCLSFQTAINYNNLYTCVNSSRSISRYRLQDGTYDCFHHDDESFGFQMACSFNLTDRIQCPRGCIPRRNFQGQQYDEVCHSIELSLVGQCLSPVEDHAFGCEFLRSGSAVWTNEKSVDIFRFWQMCDGHPTYPNADDEEYCNYWKHTCNRRGEKCNGHWDCFDGSDEVQCQTGRKSLCHDDHHYCFIGSELTCIDSDKIGDGKIDCLGATDERDNYCLLKYPNQATRRFRCANSIECVSVEHVCDGHIDCAEGDDELPCPWRASLVGKPDCPNGTFACRNERKCRFNGRDRCMKKKFDENKCSENEETWFCDLIDSPRVYSPLSLSDFNQFPLYEKHIDIIKMENPNSSAVSVKVPTMRKIDEAVYVNILLFFVLMNEKNLLNFLFLEKMWSNSAILKCRNQVQKLTFLRDM